MVPLIQMGMANREHIVVVTDCGKVALCDEATGDRKLSTFLRHAA